jgi:LSD1 subclass zinc finger protein
MAIQIECTSCRSSLKIPETAAGKHIRCPKCQKVLKVEELFDSEPDFRAPASTPRSTRPSSGETPLPIRQKLGAEQVRPRSGLANKSSYVEQNSDDETVTDYPSRRKNMGVIWAVVAVGAIALSTASAFVGYRMGVADAVSSGQAGTGTSQPTSMSDMGSKSVVDNGPPQNSTTVPASIGNAAEAPVVVAQPQASTPPVNSAPVMAPTITPPITATPPATGTTANVTTPPAAVAQLSLPENADSEVQFAPLTLDEPVTSFALTEDGRFAIFTHQNANLITVYDVLSDRSVTQISTTAPRSVLSRGDQIFVANYGEGRVSVYSISSGWAMMQELNIPKKHVLFLSAACGSAFGGELLVTCHEKSEDGNTTERFNYRVDSANDKSDLVGKYPLASVSFDGRVVLTQESFNQSPSGGIEAFAYEDFVGGDPTRIYGGGITQTPFVYQPYSGGYWFAENMIFGGTPIAQVHKDLRQILIPDLMQKIAYKCDADVFEALRVNSTMSPSLGKSRRVILPGPQKKEPSKLFQQIFRRRDYLLDRPWAVTHGNALIVFLLDQSDGTVLIARTLAYETPPVQAASVVPTGPNGPKPAPERSAKADEPKSEPASEVPAVATSAAEVSQAATTPATPAMNEAAGAGDSSGSSNKKAASRTDVLKDWPSLIAAGKSFQYPFPVSESFSIELQSGPRGMKLAESGMLQWSPKDADVGSHELKFRILEGSVPRFERPTFEVVTEDLAKAVDGDLTKINDFEQIELDVDTLAISNGYHDEDSLLLQGKTLRVLGDGDLSKVSTKTLPARYHDIAQRGNTLIAVSSKPPFLDIIDRRSMDVLKHYELKFTELEIHEITDLAAHPQQNVSYLCVRYSHELPRYTVVVINEETGEATEPGVFGTWAEVSPDGESLYTGYRDLYERGVRFHINPDWSLIEIPQYGSVDMLLAWDITGKQPKMRQAIRNAGGNGQGVRLSPDASRVVYLSHTGAKSGNLEGLATNDFKAPAVEYQTKDKCRNTEAAFHPILPWIAFPGEQRISLFDSNTGESVENRVLATPVGLGIDPIERLLFSRDGESLLLVRGGGESGRYLQQVPLAVTAKELKVVKPRPKPKKSSPVKLEPIVVPEGKLDVLSARASTKPMSSEEIAKEYLDSVVIVLSGNSAGTGFVVGDEGYILTCEHVVDSTATTTVHFRSASGDGTFVSFPAEIIRVDERQDIAMLKCVPNGKLRSVKFRAKDNIETGEPITVIGNPGAGTTLLSHTMTNGIVSNPLRMIEDVPHIQLSAAVNPGNSGGPLFDKFGNVAGLIALKANIEGASFAVPADKLREFLVSITRK